MKETRGLQGGVEVWRTDPTSWRPGLLGKCSSSWFRDLQGCLLESQTRPHPPMSDRVCGVQCSWWFEEAVMSQHQVNGHPLVVVLHSLSSTESEVQLSLTASRGEESLYSDCEEPSRGMGGC